ncbi:MAG: PEP-CTERM sorting domain-containing protein [Phycisphaerae bacterium]
MLVCLMWGTAANADTVYVSTYSYGYCGVNTISHDGTVDLFANLPNYDDAFGMAFDGQHNLYVSDSRQWGIISKITPTGSISPFATTGYYGSAGLAFGRDGYLYAAAGDAILKIAPDGTTFDFATGLRRLMGLAFDRDGYLYAAAGDAILKIAPDGTTNQFATGLYNLPWGLAIDSNNDLYVANCGDGTIVKIAPDGTTSQFATGLFGPTGLAFDSIDNLYVANQGINTISRITPAGAVSVFATGQNSPFSLAIETPEPSSLTLLLLGGGLLARKQKKRSVGYLHEAKSGKK